MTVNSKFFTIMKVLYSDIKDQGCTQELYQGGGIHLFQGPLGPKNHLETTDFTAPVQGGGAWALISPPSVVSTPLSRIEKTHLSVCIWSSDQIICHSNITMEYRPVPTPGGENVLVPGQARHTATVPSHDTASLSSFYIPQLDLRTNNMFRFKYSLIFVKDFLFRKYLKEIARIIQSLFKKE